MTDPKGCTDNVGDHKTATSIDPSLVTLHETLRSLKNNNGDGLEIEAIKAKIRAQLPAVDTARQLPHKKTPSGRTKVLHMNYMHSQNETSVDIEREHLRFFAKIVQQLGLHLEILTDVSCQEEIKRELSKDNYPTLNYTVIISQTPASKWAEDSVEYLQNGQIAALRLLDNDLLEWAIKTGRKERWQKKMSADKLEDVLRDHHLWILLGMRVNELKTGLERVRAAQTEGQKVGYIRAYVEGGNMISAEDAEGNPMVLVGKDAIAATAHIYQLSDDDVRKVIAEDFGLENIEQVVCVEQPGKFHLDMGMLFIGNGVVILNNSSTALKDAVEMAELVPCDTTEQKAAKLKLQHSLEEDAAKDLQAAGLEVRRKALESEILLYNFFNGEFVEGSDGLNYYITNGGLKEQEKIFETLMVKEWQVVQKVFFSPQKAAQKSLQDQGGVGCRLKGSGQ